MATLGYHMNFLFNISIGGYLSHLRFSSHK